MLPSLAAPALLIALHAQGAPSASDRTARLAAAQAALNAGRAAEAIPALEALYREAPQDPSVRLLLGFAQYLRGDRLAAKEHLEASLRFAPDQPDALLGLASIAFDLGHYDEAIVRLSTCIRVRPEEGRAHYLLAEIRSKKEEFDPAIVEYGLALDALREREEATPAAEIGLRAAVNADLANALHGYALALYNRRRLDESLVAYEEAARRTPQDAGVHYGLGLTAARLGDLDRAQEALGVAIRLDPMHVGARYQLGLVLEKRGDFDGAVGEFRAAFRGNPSHKGVMMNLGRALVRLASRRSGEEAASLRREGEGFLEKYRKVSAVLDEIEETSRRATREPRNAGVRLSLCTLYAEIGDVPRAAEAVRHALELRVELRTDPICLGVLNLSAGQTEEARALFGTALRIRPEFPDTYLFLSLVEEAQGRGEEAARLREDYERRKAEAAAKPKEGR